uniref:Conserved oligomeric Golgi complex subunit 6 n=1 Tax=Strongyloides stercoralis TaxID=6248 RepID=A0A0K0DTV7_STRER
MENKTNFEILSINFSLLEELNNVKDNLDILNMNESDKLFMGKNINNILEEINTYTTLRNETLSKINLLNNSITNIHNDIKFTLNVISNKSINTLTPLLNSIVTSQKLCSKEIQGG